MVEPGLCKNCPCFHNWGMAELRCVPGNVLYQSDCVLWPDLRAEGKGRLNTIKVLYFSSPVLVYYSVCLVG